MTGSEVKNPKFVKVKQMFEQGLMPDFKTIFNIAPFTTVAKEINIHHVRFKVKINDPNQFKIKELRDLAALFDVDELSLFELALKSSK